MNLNIEKDKKIEEIVENISSTINEQLLLGKKVLWFLSGGSFIPIEVLISRKIIEVPNDKITITLADERYGEIDHEESNWYKLKKEGFDFKKARILSVLCGKDVLNTTKDITDLIQEEIETSEYKIGLFGIGEDGHIAGILPNSEAIKTNHLIYTYNSPPFLRITITPKTILCLDKAFVYVSGLSKLPVIEKLKTDTPTIIEQPAQILKSIPSLTIFIKN